VVDRTASVGEVSRAARAAYDPAPVATRLQVVLAGALAALVLGMPIATPFSPDSFLALQRIWDVSHRGNWLLIHDVYPEYDHRSKARDDEGWLSRKPPLFYWLAACAVHLSGGRLDEVSARALSLAAAVGVAAIAFAWCAGRLGAAPAWIALLFLLGSYGFAGRALSLHVDMLFVCFLFSGWCALGPLLDGRPTRERAAIAGVLIGLAALTKGPVAYALAGLGGIFYLALTHQSLGARLREPTLWAAAGIAVGVAALWFVPALVAGGSTYAAVVWDESFGHFLPASFGGAGHAHQPIYFIAVRMAGQSLPASLLLPALALALRRGEIDSRIRSAIVFQLSLALATLLLFTAGATKRDEYVLPAMPGIAIGCAALFALSAGSGATRLMSAASVRNATVGLIGVVALVSACGAMLAVVLGVTPGVDQLPLAWRDALYARLIVERIAAVEPAFLAAAGVTAAAGVVMCIGVRRERPIWQGAAVGVLAVTLVTYWIADLRTEVNRLRDLRRFTVAVEQTIGDAPVYYLFERPRPVWFYRGGRYVPRLDEAAGDAAVRDGGAYLLARKAEIDRRAAAELRSRLTLVIEANDRAPGESMALWRIGAPARLSAP
jgi:4-amino-4-deoxy-L-arabinose transferase-like glycosyltransferase